MIHGGPRWKFDCPNILRRLLRRLSLCSTRGDWSGEPRGDNPGSTPGVVMIFLVLLPLKPPGECFCCQDFAARRRADAVRARRTGAPRTALLARVARVCVVHTATRRRRADAFARARRRARAAAVRTRRTSGRAAERCGRAVRPSGAAERCGRTVRPNGAAERCGRAVRPSGAAERCG